MTLRTPHSVFLLLSLLLAACGSGGSRTPVTSGPPLSGGGGSVEELIDLGLRALERRDTAALAALAVTREEYEGIILPGMGGKYPAARDTSRQARGFIADNHFMSSGKALRRALNDVGGNRLAYGDASFRETTALEGYTLYEGTRVTVRTAEGERRDLALFGSVVERGGVYKLLGWRDRD